MANEIGKIYAAIPAIMAEIGAIGKDRRNAQQGYAYRGIEDFYNVIQPLMVKHRVFSVPEILSKEREERTSAKGSVLIYTTMTVKYTFFAEDGSSVVATVSGEGMDSGDKSANKALSVAHKYALAQIFAVPTADMTDPETESHEIKAREPEPAKADTTFVREGLLALLEIAQDSIGKSNADKLREIISSGKHDGDIAWYEKAIVATKAKMAEQEALLAANTTPNPAAVAVGKLQAAASAMGRGAGEVKQGGMPHDHE